VAPDFEAEGLLEGLEGEAREARARLLAELAGDGVSVEELRRAVEEDRLALVPVERVLGGGGGLHTVSDVAERAGVERELLERYWRALGMAVAAEDQKVFTDRDLAAARRIAALRGAGLPDEGILEIARLLGMTMSQLAAANRRLIADAFLYEGDTEYEVATRFAQVAKAFMPAIGELLSYVLELHLREQIRHDAVGATELSAGRLESAQEVTVCFADMVGFTQLGESLEPDELGGVTGRLSELVAEIVEPPVRLVKLIGDAAMLVGPEPRPVLDAALAVVESAEREGEGFPLLRAGVACGEALARAGDWYGRPVNLASRITTRARPGSVLASEEVHDALETGYRWSFAGAKRLKGIEGETKLYRCRRDSVAEEG
jgi:adenylate cyclase